MGMLSGKDHVKDRLRIGALAFLLLAAPGAATASTYLAEGFVTDDFADVLEDGVASVIATETPAAGAPETGDLGALVGAGPIVAGTVDATGNSGEAGFAFASGATTSILSVANTGANPIVVSIGLDWFLDISALGGAEALAGLTLAPGTGSAALFSYDPLDVLFEKDLLADLAAPYVGSSGSTSFDVTLAPSESTVIGLLLDASGFADSAQADFGVFADASLTVAGVRDDVAPVPLPAALPMLLAGLGGLALLRRRG